jgi:hypothetical protein
MLIHSSIPGLLMSFHGLPFNARRMGCEQQILPRVQNPLLFMACSLVNFGVPSNDTNHLACCSNTLCIFARAATTKQMSSQKPLQDISLCNILSVETHITGHIKRLKNDKHVYMM